MAQEIKRILNAHDNMNDQTKTHIENPNGCENEIDDEKSGQIIGAQKLDKSTKHELKFEKKTKQLPKPQTSRSTPKTEAIFKPRKDIVSEQFRRNWTNAPPTNVAVTSWINFSSMSQGKSLPDLPAMSHDTTRYSSIFETLKKFLETFKINISKFTEREESLGTLSKSQSHKNISETVVVTPG